MADGQRVYEVRIVMLREYAATLPVRAASQAEADAKALEAWEQNACERGLYGLRLGLPEPWQELECCNRDPEVYLGHRCVDCGKETIHDEYYMVRDELWAATRLTGEGGMLCLGCLERRIGRPLEWWDFTHITPTLAAWKRHLTARHAQPIVPATLPAPQATPDRSRNERYPFSSL